MESNETCQHIHRIGADGTLLCNKPAVERAPNGLSYCTRHIDIHVHAQWDSYGGDTEEYGSFDEEEEIEITDDSFDLGEEHETDDSE
jgi:hypothetical protein